MGIVGVKVWERCVWVFGYCEVVVVCRDCVVVSVGASNDR